MQTLPAEPLAPSSRPLSGPRVLPFTLVAAATALSVVITVAIAPGVPLAALVNLAGLALALTLWRLPHRALTIAAAVLLGAVTLLQWWAGQDLLAVLHLSIVGALGLRRFPRGWLYLLTGMIGVLAAWSAITMSLREGLMPLLYTEALPALDLHLPPLLLAILLMVAALAMIGLGTWRAALHLDLLAIALIVAAAAHLLAGLLGWVSLTLPMGLAQTFPDRYSFDEQSWEMAHAMVSLLRTNSRVVIMAVLIPLGLGIAAIVRIARQPTVTWHGGVQEGASGLLMGLTGLALGVPGLLILGTSRLSATTPLQVALPVLTDLVALVLWSAAVTVWWRHTAAVRANRVPGAGMTTTALATTLVLAAAPALLGALELALILVP